MRMHLYYRDTTGTAYDGAMGRHWSNGTELTGGAEPCIACLCGIICLLGFTANTVRSVCRLYLCFTVRIHQDTI